MKFEKINIMMCSIIVLCTSCGSLFNLFSNNALSNLEYSVHNLLSGQLVYSISDAVDKNVVARDKMISFADRLTQLKGVGIIEGVDIINSDGINLNADLDNPESMTTDWGQIVLFDGKALEVNGFNQEASQKYADAMNKLAGHGDLNVNLMLIPTQIEFIADSNIQKLTYSQKASIDFIYNQLDSKIKAINVYDTLKMHADEYIYFRTDHHWTSLGAYYAYCELMMSLGDEPLSLDAFEEKTSVPFMGSLYTLTNSDTLLANPDVVTVYKPQLDYTYEVLEDDVWVNKQLISDYYLNKEKFAYEAFLEGDFMLSKIVTNSAKNDSIAILKDSYANALIPYIVPHYKNIYIIDPRAYEGDVYDFLEKNSVKDILIINYALVNRFSGYADFYTKLFE